jgi:hypothetical protein
VIWHTFIWWKIRQSAALFWFGLRNVEVLHYQAAIQRTIDVPPEFLEHGSAKKIAVWAHANRNPNKQEFGSFMHESAQNFELLSNIQDQKFKIQNL